jgi:hypothetical protein
VQEECIKKVAQKLNLKESLLFEEMLKKKYKNETGRKYDSNMRFGSEEKEVVPESIVPLKKVEVEALRLIINGLGTRIDELLSLGPDYFKFDDTRELYSVIRDEIIKARNAGEKVNFPVKISSEKLINGEARKLYNYILFSETQFADRDNNLAAIEIINNLRGFRILEEIENIRKKMIEYEKSRSMNEGAYDDKLACEYDRLYHRLIELEKEKMSLKII